MKRFDKFVVTKWKLVRQKREKIVYKILYPVIKINFPADVVSLVGLLLGVISIFYLGKSNIIFCLLWLSKRLFDIIDGPIARANGVKLIKFIDVDRFCDIVYNVLLFFSTIYFVGIILSLVSILLYIIHILLDYNEIGKNPIVGPSNNAIIFFVFGEIKLGLIFQIIFTLSALFYNRIK